MIEIQATEAKAHLAELLSRVARGETIAITRHGQRVAHLVPAKTQDQKLRQERIAAFKEKRKGWKKTPLSTDDILDLRHDGHRH